MQLRLFFTKWTQIAGLLLIGGAFAWMIKLGVIISTNGRIIDTGAAALMMKVGLLLLFVGSTGIGNFLSHNYNLLLRILAIVLSPVIVFASFILIPMITSPLLHKSNVWYAQQEAPIGVAVFLYFAIGTFLFRRHRSVAQ